MAKIELRYRNDYQHIKNVENKLIVHNGEILLFTDVKFVCEKKTYGRKMNKTKDVEYVECTVYAYNHIGEFVGVCSDDYLKFFIWNWELSHKIPNARNDYKKLETMMVNMKNKLDEVTTPDFVKPL